MEKLKKITDEERKIIKGEQELDRNLYMIGAKSHIINSKKILEDGKLIGIRPHTRFIHFPEHSHNYVEIVYICDGSVKHIIDGKEIALQKGELLFLNQYAKQEILPAKEEDLAINFVVLPEFFDTTLSMISNEESILKDFIIGCLKKRK